MKLRKQIIIILLFISSLSVLGNATSAARETNSLMEKDLVAEGARYYKNKEYEKAVDSFQKAIHIDENNADAYAKLGAAYITLSQYKEAIPYLQKAIEIKSENLSDFSRSLVYINLVNAYLHLGDIEQAKIWSERAIQSNHDNVTVYELIAAYYGGKGAYQEGISYLEECIKLNPHSFSTHLLLGTMYIEKGIRDKDESELERGRNYTLKAKALLEEKKWNEKDLKKIEQNLKDLDEYEHKLQK